MWTNLPVALGLLLAQHVTAFGVPLEKRVNSPMVMTSQNGTCNLDAVRLNLAQTTLKYKANAANLERNLNSTRGRLGKRFTGKSTVALRPLHSQESGSYWTGSIGLGTPVKTFSVVFDTGSTDSTFCGAAACSMRGRRRVYSAKKSKTAKATGDWFLNTYGDGSESYGPVYKDTVQVTNDLRSFQQDLNIASRMAGPLSSIDTDGVMGFAFPSLSSSLISQSTSANLLKQKKTKTNTVGFRLSTTPGVSQLFWGGYDKKAVPKESLISWYPIGKDPLQPTVYTYLQIANSVAWLNGKKVKATKASYILDTGTTLIVAPTKAAKAFWAQVSNAKAMGGDNDGYWSYPCNSPPSLAFSFGGSNKQHVVPAEYLNFGRIGSSSRCMGAVVGAEAGVGDSWILGDAFLMSVYSIFSVSKMQIGLANI